MRLPTDPVPRWVQGRDALGWVTVVVGTVVLAALLYLVVLIPTGTHVLPVKSTGDQRLHDLNSLQAAAQNELMALYALDYKSVDQTVSTVAAGATGTFAGQWQDQSVTFRAGVAQLQTHSTATITALAVHQVKGNSATLLASVYQDLTNNKTTATKATEKCAAGHYCGTYHLWMTYQRVGGHWKMSTLDYFNE